MVSTATTIEALPAQTVPILSPDITVVEPPREASKKRCPRCSTSLMISYEELLCPCCGYVDHAHTKISGRQGQPSLISTATRYILRYVGDFPTLTDTLAHVKLIRVRNRVVYAVKCPFCQKGMDQSSLSGKRPEVREQRYKCMEGHRVSLVPCKNGMLGWQ